MDWKLNTYDRAIVPDLQGMGDDGLSINVEIGIRGAVNIEVLNATEEDFEIEIPAAKFQALLEEYEKWKKG